jgi:hypothetical protein
MKLEIPTPSKSPERVREYNKRYRELFPERVKQASKNWVTRNRERDKKRKHDYFFKRKKYYREKRRKENFELKLEVFSFYTNKKMKCEFCEERRIECLQLDHIHNNGSKEREKLNRRGTNFYRWLKQNGFPEGYQILCANCNVFKRFNPEWKGI